MWEKIVSYGGVGLLSTTLHYVMFLSTMSFLGALYASAAGALAGAFLSYSINAHHTFPKMRGRRLSKMRFFLVALLSNSVNAMCMSSGLSVFPLYPISIQVLTTVLVFFTGFFLNFFWSYTYE